MIEALFVIVWTALFVAVAYVLWVMVVHHWKVYLMIAVNWFYLTGIFFFYPKLHEIATQIYGYFA